MIGFIHIPKCAGSSVQQWFHANHVKLYRRGHLRLDEYDTADLAQADRWFAIVRDPFDRAISQYEFCRVKAKRMLAKNPRLHYYQQMLNMYDLGFGFWLRHYHHLNARFHCTQFSYISISGQIAVDMVLRFENLAQEWYSIAALTGCDEPLPHVKKSLRSRDEYYSSADRDFVLRKYHQDFDRLGYADS